MLSNRVLFVGQLPASCTDAAPSLGAAILSARVSIDTHSVSLRTLVLGSVYYIRMYIHM